MKIFKHFLLGLLTTLFCVYLSYFVDSSDYSTIAFTKSKVHSLNVSGADNQKLNNQELSNQKSSNQKSKIAVNQSQSSELLQQSQELYQAGKYVDAIEILKRAVNQSQVNNDKFNEAIALSNLSLAYQKLGKWQEATQTITQSIELLKTLENSGSSQQLAQVFAQTIEVRGGLELARGQIETALNTWQEAAKIYRQLDDESALIRNRINQAQAMQSLGNYLQARDILDSVEKTLEEQLKEKSDDSLRATELLSLGNVLLSLGYLEDSYKILEKSKSAAENAKNFNAQSNALLSLGNTSRAQAYAQRSMGNSDSAKNFTKDAISYYKQAAQIVSATPTVGLQAQLNQLRLLVEQKEFPTAKALLPEIQSQIDNLAPSRTAVNIRVNFAESLSKMKQSDIQPESIARMLAQTVEMAKSLKDQRSESYSLGTLGELYEQTGQLSDAEDLTQLALVKAESVDAQDIAYQWHWQMGRILQKQSDIPGATAAYSKAYNALKSLRNDLAAINPDVQFSFRESIEPVYRQYVDLLLQSDEEQNNLIQAREVIESLQLAEINNFFRSPCVRPRVEIDKLVEEQKSTAVIYPIILDDRLEIITRLPGKDKKDKIYRRSTKVSKEELENTVERLREYLPNPSRVPEVQENSQNLYEWLIKPIESNLVDIKSLVFVLDGSLRNIPMGLLYDEQQDKYLIEKYAIALTPGLQLVDPKPLETVQLNALVAGIAQENNVPEIGIVPALPSVKQELKKVQAKVKKSQELLDQKFTKQSLKNKIQSNPFSVVHLATHGQFSSDPEQTYISVWEDSLKVKELDSLLRVRVQNRPETIELLVLSACKTAAGDKRAALGLAGVAVRAGARSTLATLWTVDDESTTNFISELYAQLNAGVTKAEALRQAQLAILAKENRPYFWAPYVLVGNWL